MRPSEAWTVRVGSGREARDYPVVAERGLLARLPQLVREHAPAHKYAVISDATVAGLYGAGVLDGFRREGLDGFIVPFPAGEKSKSREEWARLTDALLDGGVGRDGAVVALGGGVTGDLAGFVAATYMRGVPLVQVPTSLLAMIDASIGGKVGVSVEGGKNLVGAFHPPRLVVTDPECTSTLSPQERAQGAVEALKHGAVLDRDYLNRLRDRLEALLAGDADVTTDAVRRSVELKAAVVSGDERETGRRTILNFGHTLGHALEAASGYQISHGSAVALGMVLEARIGERLGVTAPGTAQALREVTGCLPLSPFRRGPEEFQRAMSFLGRDKKARAGRPRVVLLSTLGSVASAAGSGASGWTHEVPHEVVEEVLLAGMREM